MDVAGFWLARAETRTLGYLVCVAAGACVELADRAGAAEPLAFRGLPARGLSWAQARDYCAWRGARLPTEAESQWAAQAGPRALPWIGSFEKPSCHGPAGPRGDRPPARPEHVHQTTTVQAAPPFGDLLGLRGNVWEWTADDLPGPGWWARARHGQRGDSYLSVGEHDWRTRTRTLLAADLTLDDAGVRCAADEMGPPPRPSAHQTR